MLSSFERNICVNESIVGTRMSAKGMQWMTSTGIPSLDSLLGNGFAFNSINLLGFHSFHNLIQLL
jgi:hypothetical protein